MQTASILLNLAGDAGNQVQKSNVTPSEVHVLQVIHGDDAVVDIDITGDVQRTSKQERERLVETYRRAQSDGSYRSPAVDMLFPGVAARLYERFDELDLDESFFKVKRDTAPARDPLDHDGDGKKGGTVASTDSGFKGMTVAELKAYAEDRSIDLSDATKKADIIAAIELASEQPVDQSTAPVSGDVDDEDGDFEQMPDENLFK